MAKLSLEKYVEACVKNLKDKFIEEKIISHIENLKQVGEYNNLAVRVVYNGCHIAYPIWENSQRKIMTTAMTQRLSPFILKPLRLLIQRDGRRLRN